MSNHPHPRLHRVVRDRRDILAVIAAGGALGSLGRWSVGELIPHESGRFAWSTFCVNVSGAFVLGLLLAFLADVMASHRYLRPFVAVGLLGGWTTFSTYMLDTRDMLAAGHLSTALLWYLGGTLVVGLVGVWIGVVAGRALVAAGTRARPER